MISNKSIFVEFNTFLNTKIIETLFDFNLISNSLLNIDINMIQLQKEEDDICNIINKNKKENDDDYDIIIIDENEKENEITNIEKNNKYCNNKLKSKHSNISNTYNTSKITSEKINISLEEDEKSFTDSKYSFNSNNSNNSNNEYTENKNKYIIMPMNNKSLFDTLNYIEFKENNLKEINNSEYLKITNDQIIKKVEEIVENNKSDKLMVKNCYLRKMACVKLYKAFCHLFKNYDIRNAQIQDLCKYIEYSARNKDIDMKSQYKQYIFNLLKKISL
jgi:hypothetical protein